MKIRKIEKCQNGTDTINTWKQSLAIYDIDEETVYSDAIESFHEGCNSLITNYYPSSAKGKLFNYNIFSVLIFKKSVFLVLVKAFQHNICHFKARLFWYTSYGYDHFRGRG